MIEAWLEKATGIMWNYPVVGLCLFAGVFFSLRMTFIQIRCFPHAIALISGKYDHDHEPGELTHFQALSAALSGTVGLGNIAGVAIAIAMGGPGAIFWMWVIGFFGMSSKYVECALGTIFREKHPENGRWRGGPMYYITKGLGKRWTPLAIFFSACLALGAFGAANMFQANQVAIALDKYLSVPNWVTGIILSSLIGLTIIGGIKRIGKITSAIVPGMCAVYLLAAWFICLLNIDRLPDVFNIIVTDAFSGSAVIGGSFGAVILTGVRRAVFSNEAGLGSAPIAHAVVKTNHPIREGIVASLGPLIDTILVCSATAAVIILSGSYGTEMHEAVSTISITSKNQQEISFNSAWAIEKQNIPEESEALRQFRAEGGEFVLAHANNNYTGSAITPAISIMDKKGASKNPLEHIQDGIRFSCHRSGEGCSVQLLDKKGLLIGSLNVNEKGDSITELSKEKGETRTLMSITPCSKENKWHSHLITFDKRFKRDVLKAEGNKNSLQLQYTVTNPKASWYVDRFQSFTKLEGIALTTEAFNGFISGFGSIIIPLSVIFFCYSTMITWSFYGETAAEFIFGPKAGLPYKILFVIAAFCGAIFKSTPVLNFSDLMLALMVIPNFIAMFLLSKGVIYHTERYFNRLKAGDFSKKNDTSI